MFTEGADDLDVENVTAHNASDGRIRLRWQDPAAPNGLIVTYEIKYSKVGVTNVSTARCPRISGLERLGVGGGGKGSHVTVLVWVRFINLNCESA